MSPSPTTPSTDWAAACSASRTTHWPWPGACAPARVIVNNGEFNLAAPFGGYKQSGNGRELGRFGIEEYLELKAIHR
ncbi:aldehyde dehydrogenase family protein [Streptomyces sp. NBC_00117]|uniref:aldehyde dehydrogenase family protein n=1 Tax=Streptomyces sp. NBC_00117 TaxID=2975657 RepID=UPI0038685BA7